MHSVQVHPLTTTSPREPTTIFVVAVGERDLKMRIDALAPPSADLLHVLKGGGAARFRIPRKLTHNGVEYTIEIVELTNAVGAIEVDADYHLLPPQAIGSVADRFIDLRASPGGDMTPRRGSGNIRVRESGGGGDL
ncbi:MAG: hypothetical protein R3B09_16580 [Nannocystaceae bacterium]